MEKTVKILRSEISELVIKVQRFYALETVKKILEVNPERIEEFVKKLVDCLEKCLICRHIRRFAD